MGDESSESLLESLLESLSAFRPFRVAAAGAAGCSFSRLAYRRG